jgi:hypothetical protein
VALRARSRRARAPRACSLRARTSARHGAWLGLALALVLGACDSRRDTHIDTPPPAPLVAQRPPPARAEPALRADAGVPVERGPRIPKPPPPAPDETAPLDATTAEGATSERWIIDGLADVAAAGPATATAQGVVMFNRKNQLWLAPLAHVPKSRKSVPTPIGSIGAGARPFPLARGAAVRKGVAYWVSQGQLLRQKLALAGSGAAPETLARDARAGTRAAVPVGASELLARLPNMAAYISGGDDPEQPLVAKLWLEGAEAPLRLTEDGASAHSVAVVAADAGVSVLSLEARTGLSPLHLRRVDLARPATPLLGEDTVTWVGGTSRPTTEVQAHGIDRGKAFGLIAIERDITRFGLALLDLALDSREPAPDPSWLDYKNGIEPAPFSLATVCGRSVALLARPTSEEPDSPQELLWQPLGVPAGKDALVLGRSAAFFDVSLASIEGGALLTYVADRRTWARTVRCSPH